jgi:hypothetical protein
MGAVHGSTTLDPRETLRSVYQQAAFAASGLPRCMTAHHSIPVMDAVVLLDEPMTAYC